MVASSSAPASLTADPDRFSDAAWDLLLTAQDTARRWRHASMDVEHLLQALLQDPRWARFVDPLPLDPEAALDRIEAFCAEQPPARGEELYIGDALEDLLEAADRRRGAWGSRLLDVPHLLLALLEEPRLGASLLAEQGLSEDLLLRQLRFGAGGGAGGVAASGTADPWRGESEPCAPPPLPERSQESWVDGGGRARGSAAAASATASAASAGPSAFAAAGSARAYRRPEAPRTAMAPPPDAAGLDGAPEDGLRLEAEPAALELYGRDLTAAARAGELDPVIGRDAEIRRLIQVLSRRGKNNPVLIGEPGVGKTAVAELLAQRIVAGEVPEALRGLRLVALDLGALIAGAKFRGQFEERLRSVLEEVRQADAGAEAGSGAGVVLFIDELHTVVSSDRSSADAGSILKPALARGDLRCIGATTPEEYRRTIEKDPGLDRRFQQVVIREPAPDTCVEMLRGLKERYELHHGVAITDAALVAAARLADRYIAARCLPDSAIDLVDEAAARLKMEVTSKPQAVEQAEAELRRVELALLSAEAAPLAERVQLQEQRRGATERLQALQRRWGEERERLAELRELLQHDEELRHAIAEAERDGDYEEAARMQVDQLQPVQQRRLAIEDDLQ
ncbi:MAG: Clp protease N-terminal domain-containing protein, partial [Synechococcus sp.]|nr:Clp protease N-terminal domain-containing protein [Synechococcus sp.]